MSTAGRAYGLPSCQTPVGPDRLSASGVSQQPERPPQLVHRGRLRPGYRLVREEAGDPRGVRGRGQEGHARLTCRAEPRRCARSRPRPLPSSPPRRSPPRHRSRAAAHRRAARPATALRRPAWPARGRPGCPDRRRWSIGASVALHVYVPDVDALTAQAVAAGAELLTPPTDMSYGARQSMLRDPFGHIWIFLTPIAT